MFASRLTALLAAALLSAPVAGAQQNAAAAPLPEQTITLFSYGYTPAVVRLDAGAPVTLHFVNRAGKSHDYTARKFFRSSRILSGEVTDGEVELGPGQTRNVTLVPTAGIYEMHCGHPFHKMLGMQGNIVVN
jgi:plastocyanin